ncbi:ferrous iron transport protein A [Candidatus Bathyarchaeota archaeon]|nr:ferrous iron transport protein A [Candidatus Bathyarchaeota archaeon]
MEQPLTKLRPGETAVIISTNSPQNNPHGRHGSNWSTDVGPVKMGRRRNFQKRLEDMGLTPGTRIKVVKSAPFNGPLELQVRGSRLALGRGMAERILVRVER